MPRWWTGTGPDDDAGGGLGDECEAFLAGTWVDYLEAHGKPVPSWSWLNRVAHKGEDELRSMAGAGGPSWRQAEPWSQASSFLAGELLDFAERTSRGVSEFQRDALVPLELSLFADTGAKRLNPGQLVARALTGLPDRWSRRT